MLARSWLGATALVALLWTGAAQAADEKIAFIPQLVGIPYFNAMQAGGNRAAHDLGVSFIYQGPVDANPVDQLQILTNLVNQGVQAIAVSVLDASSIDPVIAEAKAKGTTIFTSDSDAPKSGRAAFVAQATDQALGYTIIDELIKRVGDRGKIGIVSGVPTATNLNTWIGFMQERVKQKYPDVTLLAPQYAGGSAQRASQIATDLMTANPDIKGIIAVASTTCPGVAQAIDSAGMIGEVVGTGYCSPDTARSYLKSGAMGFTVLWDPEALGYLTVWAGKQLVDKKPFAPSNDVAGIGHPVSYDPATKVLLLGPPTVFTRDNVDKYHF